MMDKGNKRKKKPLRYAKRWSAQVPGMMARFAGLMVAIIVMGVIFSVLQAIDALWLRSLLSLLLLAGMLILCMNEGLVKGAADAAASRAYDSMESRGLPVGKKEDAACYHPMKAVCAAGLLFALPLCLGVYMALTAKDYTYTLQDLPLWVMDGYGARADVMAPLGAYMQETAIGVKDYVRMFVRLPIMMHINLFPDPVTMTGMIDRLSPLLIALYPLLYVAGYLRGPAANRKMEKVNRKAKKIAVRKSQKKGLAAELTGGQPQVHYGQRADAAKHKKKELV